MAALIDGVAKPTPLISKADASYVFWPETEYRCKDECINLKSATQCAILGSLVQIDAPAGSCDYYIHGGLTEWDMPVTGCITKESAGYAENPSKQGFGCKRCKFFDADGLDCYRGVDKDSPGPAPGIIHPNGCCNLNEPDAKRGKMTRQELTELFDSDGFSEAARLLNEMTLTEGIQVLARKIQEGMMQGDVCSRLRDAINDMGRASGSPWSCYYIDHDGDGESGNVVYSCNGDIRMSSYEIGDVGGKASCNIDFENSTNVVPVTTYQPEAEDEDHYTSMEASMRGDKLYSVLPVYERFISKSTRKAASSDSFAGKGRSFPILKAEDVSAALHSIGRAGPGNYSADTLRSNIKRIAKAKGFPLPDSLKDEGSDESARESIGLATVLAGQAFYKSLRTVGNDSTHGAHGSGSRAAGRGNGASQSSSGQRVASGSRETGHSQSTWKPDGVLLRESATFLEAPRLVEATTSDYPIKLISPGRGSSGYYPPSVLQKASEGKVFKAGTQMFWNHDTDAEEAARPEGDLDRLAAVTTTDAQWDEAGHDGPGLYARAKVFSDYADKVKEKGPHIGLSIRAGGHRDEAAMGPDGKKGVITALKNAASVDFVTKAGRDGKIFTESATAQEGEDMDKTEIQALFKEALDAALAPLQAQNKKLAEALAQQTLEKTVPKMVEKLLTDIRLPDPTKRTIVEKFTTPTIMALLPMKEGAVDEAELGKMVEAEAGRQRDYLIALGYGGDIPAQGVRMTEAELKQTETDRQKESAAVMESLTDLFVGEADKNNPAREKARVAFINGRAA